MDAPATRGMQARVPTKGKQTAAERTLQALQTTCPVPAHALQCAWDLSEESRVAACEGRKKTEALNWFGLVSQ